VSHIFFGGGKEKIGGGIDPYVTMHMVKMILSC